MLNFYPCEFFNYGVRLVILQHIDVFQRVLNKLTDAKFSEIRSEIEQIENNCIRYGFSSSAMQCRRILERLHEQPLNHQSVVALLKDLILRIQDDLHAHQFLHLSLSEADLYLKPTKQWEEIIDCFPRSAHDIEESSKCFALGRYAASLFHILLVAELGVIEVCRLFEVQGDKPGWGSLERLVRINDKQWTARSPLEQKYSDFLKNLLPLALAIKNAWRHKISHVDNKLVWLDTDFSPEVADEIITATRGFMRTLIKDLPKSPRVREAMENE